MKNTCTKITTIETKAEVPSDAAKIAKEFFDAIRTYVESMEEGEKTAEDLRQMSMFAHVEARAESLCDILSIELDDEQFQEVMGELDKVNYEAEANRAIRVAATEADAIYANRDDANDPDESCTDAELIRREFVAHASRFLEFSEDRDYDAMLVLIDAKLANVQTLDDVKAFTK